MPILFGNCSNLPDLLTKNIGRSLLVIVVVFSFGWKFRSPCYCRRRSWLGLVYIPFPWAWGVISCPFLHYRTFLQVLLPRLISRQGGEGMHSRLLLRWFIGARRRFDSIRGRSTRSNCFSRTIPPEMMRLSVLLIACRFANIIFSRLDESQGSQATSLPTFLLFWWPLLARVQWRSAPLLLLCRMPACTTGSTRKFVVSYLFPSCLDGGICLGMAALVLSLWIFWRSWMWGVLRSFWLGMAKSREDFLDISWEREFYPSFSVVIPLECDTSEARSGPIHFHHVPLRHYF